jgi:hypothetical protein
MGATDALHTFSAKCRDCEQIERNEKKNEDRPLAIVRARAARKAAELKVPFDFIWINMNYQGLVPYFRAALSGEATCRSCGHAYQGERDIQTDHLEAPRSPDDWARQHARNLVLLCQSCNGTKGRKPLATWLDEQEGARISNELHRGEVQPNGWRQINLWD